ncbi:hypothetical protein NPIL_364341 [Nephila pilipes]|uniref:EGF-like domain-containing protein n=1 Tax=Nephila pilipes TaxID=299642 RepID=A0A8X6PCT4_NEPPI|nr:hypothetical protein NPIL_364341 [Nephila pilipes]
MKQCYCNYGFAQRNGICMAMCFGDEDCTNGTVCTRLEKNRHFCECPPNFRGKMCEINMLCENLFITCEAMGAACVVKDSEAFCECPPGKKVDLQSGLCKDICDPDKCLYGKCEVIEWDYKCRCFDGYTGLRCEENVKTKLNYQLLWHTIQISFYIVICILLFGIFCLLCFKRK